MDQHEWRRSVREVLARPLARWHDHPPLYWATLANRYLPRVVAPILVLAVAYQSAKLTWALIPGAPADGPAPVVNTAIYLPPSTAEIDIQAIMDRHLFGEISEEPVPPPVTVVEAPDTTLNLRLTAVVADARDNRRGAAIIAGEQEEKTYTVGDVIDGTRDVQLHGVHGDRVLLNRAGQLETLRLPKDADGEGGARVAVPRVATPLPAVPSLRAAPVAGAARFVNALRIDSHSEQGRMVGFRLNPGTDAAQFQLLGFQPGDVVTEINGIALNDPGLGFQVFEGLGESTVASVTLIRGGTTQVLTIDTNAL